jgi:hypothetical protein
LENNSKNPAKLPFGSLNCSVLQLAAPLPMGFTLHSEILPFSWPGKKIALLQNHGSTTSTTTSKSPVTELKTQIIAMERAKYQNKR